MTQPFVSRAASIAHPPGSTLPLRLERRMILVALSVASVGIVLALMMLAGLRVDPWRAGNLPFYGFGAAVALVSIILPRMRWRHGPAVVEAAQSYGLLMVIALTGAVASYPIAALSHGYHDAALQRIDVALGFDWVRWYRTVAGSRMLQATGTAAYRAIYVTPAVLLAYHAHTGDRAAADRFLLSFWLTAVVTLALFAFMPALGPFSYLWHGPIAYMPESDQWQLDLIPQLRRHTVPVVDLARLRGLVSAPSFHAAAAVLYMAAAWPVRRLRWPLIAVNLAMLASTPVEGTHYLADILLGMGVAGAVLAVIGSVARRRASALL